MHGELASNPEEKALSAGWIALVKSAILVNISKEATGPKPSAASFDKARSEYRNCSLALS